MKAIILILSSLLLVYCSQTPVQNQSQLDDAIDNGNQCHLINPFFDCLYSEISDLDFPEPSDTDTFKSITEDCVDDLDIETDTGNNNSLNSGLIGVRMTKSCVNNINPYSGNAIIWTELLHCLREESKKICYRK